MRILFICHGNTCRSPAAERVMAKLARKSGLVISADSAAVSNDRAGAPPTPEMQTLALARGYDLSGLQSRVLEAADFAKFYLILAMDADNIARAELLRPAGNRTPLRLFASGNTGTKPTEIADPWVTGDYPAALAQIESAARTLVQRIAAGQLLQ